MSISCHRRSRHGFERNRSACDQQQLQQSRDPRPAGRTIADDVGRAARVRLIRSAAAAGDVTRSPPVGCALRAAARSNDSAAALPADETCRAMRPSICSSRKSVCEDAPPPVGRIWASVASSCSAACEARCVSVSVSNPLVTALNLCSSASTAWANSCRNGSLPCCSNKITRIDSLWQGQYSQVDLIFFKQRQQRVENFVRAPAARIVAVEHERDAIGVTAQKLQMALAERRSQHRDAVVEAVLMGHQAIGVAFHDDRAAGLLEVVAGHVEAVQLAALGEQRRLRRVDVFGRSLVR